MSKKNHRFAPPMTLALALILTGTAGAERLSNGCQETLPIAAGETWRGAGDDPGRGHCFTIDVDAPGLLMIDLRTPGGDDGRARLAGRPGSSPSVPVKRSATSRLVAFAAPGAYRLRVAAEDTLQPLPPYKLRTAFLTGPVPELKDETDGEMEEDPNPLRSRESADGSDPLAGDVYDLSTASRSLRARLDELCASGEADDHGAAALCATRLALGVSVAGEVGNPWGDDEDVFRFHLRTVRTVEISTGGETDTLGVLSDRFGHRLGRADDGGPDGNFRLVRTLAPGTYFVRVEGARSASGPYSLTVRTLR